MTDFSEQVAAFAAKAKGCADAVVRDAVQEIGDRLIERSPVRTGRFRSNWVYGLGGASSLVTDKTDGTVVMGIDAMPVDAAGRLHVISNNLPYALALEYGASRQAPQGMVGLTALEFPSIIEAAAKKANP
jgi:hypothetical protein